MVTRKTQYGWMAMGGLLCLFGLGLTLKLRDGSRAIAQAADKEFVPPFIAPDKAPEKKPDGKSPELPPHTKKEAKKASPPPPFASFTDMPPPPPSVQLGTPSAGSGFPLESEAPPKGKKKDTPKPGSMDSDKPMSPPKPSADKGTQDPLIGTASAPMPTPTATSPPPPPPAPPLGGARLEKPTDAPPKSAGVLVSPPSFNAPGIPSPPAETRQASTRTTEPTEPHPLPGEPPLAPAPGPVQMYQVRGSETLRDIARRTLGSSDRWADIHKLNPTLQPEVTLAAGTTLRLPGDACVQEESEDVRPLPAMRAKAAAPKAKKLLPLTGTFPCNLDDNKALTLPKSIREQLGSASTVLVSPGPDKCLWLTNQAHLDRMAERLEHSPAREVDVRVFKRLYFAQTEKAGVNSEGRVTIPDRLAQFAGLQQEVVLIGIDDHFEVWDAARWRQYTQQKGGAGSTEASEQD